MADSTCEDIMDKEVKLADLRFVKQLGGVEDLMWGFGSVTQLRNGQAVTISLINADNIPYDQVDSVKTIIDRIIAKYPI